MASVGQVLAAARRQIPAAEARLLLQHVLACSHAQLAAYPERRLDAAAAARFAELVARREQGEPVAYLLGEREFYGRRFALGPAVLIPRPETELLVDLALARLRETAGPVRVLDLGTGSGVLAVTLALEHGNARVTAVEDSAAALALARENAKNLGAAVEMLRGDWFSALAQRRFDLIVSNPPYIAAGDPHLTQGDLRFEPAGALTDGSADGLASIRRIIVAAPAYLEPGGWLLLEHGYDQAERVRELFHEGPWCAAISCADINGIERVTGAERRPDGSL